MPHAESQPTTHWIHAALERYERELVRYAARLLGDLERAQDVVQEAFLRLCKEPRAAVEGRTAEWLFRVTRNLAIDTRRKEGRMNPLSDEDHTRPDERSAAPDEALEQRDTVAFVLERLARLPAKQREALRLKFQAELSYKEIAEVMGETVGNVGWLIHVGLKGLRAKLCVEGELL